MNSSRCPKHCSTNNPPPSEVIGIPHWRIQILLSRLSPSPRCRTELHCTAISPVFALSGHRLALTPIPLCVYHSPKLCRFFASSGESGRLRA
jgi:hypothetical protein